MPEQFSIHPVLNTKITAPFPDDSEIAYFAMGCFWGAERLFWQLAGVYSTAVGYAGGDSENPDYYEVCSGKTGHTETVQVVFFPEKVSYQDLLKTFWESHNPTQGMRQGNDVGSQYRSAIFYSNPEQQQLAVQSLQCYQQQLQLSGFNNITTEISTIQNFWYAEIEHQQYLQKNPSGYCGLKGSGINCSL